MKRQKGLFDEQDRLQKLSSKKDPLAVLEEHIDFEFFRSELEKILGNREVGEKGGRPAYDAVMMFKILILQRYYNISDDATEYAILDRISFMRFLGLGLQDRVPDAKTIWLFRDTLSKKGLIERLFKLLDRQLDKDGVIVHKGKIVDATIVEVPRQRNTREENQQIKEGKTPDTWSEEKLRQKDTEARWVNHNGQNFYGYKDHVKVDRQKKLITDFIVTPASVHDNEVLEDLLDKKEDKGQTLYADSAYSGERCRLICSKNGMRNRIHEKGYRGHPMTEKQKSNNQKKSKIRARVEHVFGFMTNSMNGIYLRQRSLKRIETSIGLMNLTYNLFRLTQLKIVLTK